MDNESTGYKIGVYVKYQRDKRKLSLRDFAQKTTLTPSFISKLESGEYSNVSLDVVEKLSSGFAIPFHEFMRKCKITEEHRINLPDLEFYLREKYQFPTNAVEDVKLFLTFIEKKYEKDILYLKAKHKQYWES